MSESNRLTSQDDSLVAAGVSEPTDWRRKFIGQTKKVQKLQDMLRELEAAKHALEAQLEERKQELATVRQQTTKQLNELNEQLAQLQNTLSQREVELQKIQRRQSTRNLVREKFPELLDLFDDGDIKEPDLFENDEAYENYLAKLSGKLNKQKAVPEGQGQPSVEGYVPSTPGRPSSEGATHNVQALYDELDRLNIRNPEDAKRIQEIYQILNAQQL